MDKKSMLEAMINHYTNGNKAKFATLLGVSAQTVSAWGARNTFDSELIYTKCRYLSSNWLLTGEGSMLRDNKTSEETTMNHSTEKVQSAPSDAVTLRLMDRLEEKDAKIDQLQSELRTMEKELAVFKSKHEPHLEPLKRAPKSSDPAKPAFTKQPSSLTVDNATSAIVP